MRSQIGIVLALALAGFVAGAAAQGFPNRPVRMVVPLAPGGTNDTLARIVADRLAQRLGQQIVVDNRPGAGSVIGSEIVARASPDGHTLLMMGGGHSINPSLQRKLPYDTERDFAAIGLVASGPYLMVIHPSVPAKTAKEFVAWVKSKPGEVNYASAGTGNPTHLAGELLNMAASLDMRHVPYKGGGAVLPDLIAGRVSMFFSSIATVQAHVQAGRLRPIAVTTPKRSGFLPDVPTFVEAGVNGVDINGWYGLLTTGRTPRAVVQRLNADLSRVLADAETRERFNRSGVEDPEPGSAEAFEALIRQEIAKWAKVVRQAGIKLE